MLYKFFNKKGNITVVLIGLISVMLLMTLALSKRMTGHTQLLTLGDYTQISRYFLESCANQVIMQVREQVNDSSSPLNAEICKGIDDSGDDVDITDIFLRNYKPSQQLKDLADKAYGSNNKIDFNYKNKDNLKIELTDRPKPLGYIVKNQSLFVIDDDKKADRLGEEKKGVLKITCACTFKKRKYKLEVKYPFSVVFRMTPVLKDFALFVDNIYQEQKWEEQIKSNDKDSFDRLNILAIENGKIVQTDKAKSLEKDREFQYNSSNFKLRPMILLQPLEEWDLTGQTEEQKISGMIYFGPSKRDFEKSIFYNLAGISPKSSNTLNDFIDHSDIAIVSPDSVGLPQDMDITTDTTNFPISIDNDSGVKAYGKNYPLKKVGEMYLGVFGFCKEFNDFFDNTKYNLKEFFNDDENILMKPEHETFWGEMVKKSLDYKDYYGYSFGIKLFGLHYKSTGVDRILPMKRQIFGNVFARFMQLTFWNGGSGSGEALRFNPDCTIDEVEPQKLGWIKDREVPVYFRPKEYEEGMGETRQREMYNKYMSKTMSGMVAKGNYKKNGGGRNQDLFMPVNYNYEAGGVHEIFDETDFEANDGFKFNRSSGFNFDKFGDTWFGVSENQDNSNSQTELSPIEKRIGRAFNSEEEFKEAVGYPKKFKINGVVYVKGNLNLTEDMNLKPEDCSGGIVLVDGNIKLGNIFRGEKIDSSKFEIYTGSFKGVETYKGWVTSTEKTYIKEDQILTFVCLKQGNESRKIEIKGNVLLGVQLINLTNNSITRNPIDQIEWNVDDLNKDIIFYGSIVCNQLNLPYRLNEFGKIKKSCDSVLDAPVFLYPPVMATSTPPLAVQIMENMRSYKLTSGVASE